MEIVVRWTREDLEKKLREELEGSGYRLKVPPPGADGAIGSAFRWTKRPSFGVEVIAEPDPNFVLKSPLGNSFSHLMPGVGRDLETERQAVQLERQQLQAEQDAVDSALDPTQLSPGADEAEMGELLAANEKLRALGDEKKPRTRKRMPGETDERP